MRKALYFILMAAYWGCQVRIAYLLAKKGPDGKILKTELIAMGLAFATGFILVLWLQMTYHILF